MNDIVTSPSALLLCSILGFAVALQVMGDIRDALAHKVPHKQPKRATQCTELSFTAALIASQEQLRAYRRRSLGITNHPETKAKANAAISLYAPTCVAALIIVILITWLEGVVPASIFVLLCMAITILISLLAWSPDHKIKRQDKLAIALLTPYALFVKVSPRR